MTKVLIVERDDAVREARRFVLADAGHDVMEAVNEQIAVRVLSSARQPVVVLFDLLTLNADDRNTLTTIAADERLARRHAYVVFAPDLRAVSAALQPILMIPNAYIIQWPASDDALLRIVTMASERALSNYPPVAHPRQKQRTHTMRRQVSALPRGAI